MTRKIHIVCCSTGSAYDGDNEDWIVRAFVDPAKAMAFQKDAEARVRFARDKALNLWGQGKRPTYSELGIADLAPHKPNDAMSSDEGMFQVEECELEE